MGTLSVWEHVQGRWSWIFDYELPTRFDPKKGSTEAQITAEQQRRNRLFGQHGFSPNMRKKLEQKLKDQSPPPKPGEPEWRYFW